MRLLLLILAFAGTMPTAEAARISLVGAANSSEPHEPGNTYAAKTGYGAGLLLELKLMPWLGLEGGFLMIPRAYQTTDLATNVTTRYSGKIYEIPALLRMHLGRLMSFGVGGYVAKASGELSTETTTGTAVSSGTTTYLARNQTTGDFGALASLALYFRLGPVTYLTFDGRYTMGLRNNSTVAGSDRKFNDMQLLAGLQIGF